VARRIQVRKVSAAGSECNPREWLGGGQFGEEDGIAGGGRLGQKIG